MGSTSNKIVPTMHSNIVTKIPKELLIERAQNNLPRPVPTLKESRPSNRRNQHFSE